VAVLIDSQIAEGLVGRMIRLRAAQSQASAKIYTVSELQANHKELSGMRVRVRGVVLNPPFDRSTRNVAVAVADPGKADMVLLEPLQNLTHPLEVGEMLTLEGTVGEFHGGLLWLKNGHIQQRQVRP
jgi:hypothetical protein